MLYNARMANSIEQPETIQQVDDRDQIGSALHKLSLTEQIVLIGIFFEGFTRKEIASDLELEESHISKHVSRGIDKLRRILGSRD